MTDRSRPGDDGSLPPSDPGHGPGGRSGRPGKAAGREPRFTADIMLTGTTWHHPASPTASPDGSSGPGGPGGRAGASEAARADLEAAFAAGFTHQADRDRAHQADRDRTPCDCARCDCGGPGGNLAAGNLADGGMAAGFAPGGVLDQMLPGAELAAHLAAARRAGFGRLTDTETCGVIAACRRLASWAAEGELSAIATLDGRRATPSGGPGEQVDAEIAPLLTLTPQGAAALAGLARDLARLPQTRALLAAGIIDPDRAKIIAQGLSVLPDDDAAAVEDTVARRAGKQTTGKLRAAVVRAVKAHDPEAAERRKDKAQEDARVEVWAEPAGTAALAGRDLPPAGVIEGDKSLDADARWLKARGVTGGHDQLRADAFLARLTGKPLTSLIPPAAPAGGAGASATAPGATTGGGAGPAPGSTGTSGPVPGSTGSGVAGPTPGSTRPETAGTRPGTGDTDPAPDQTGPRLGGTVHLTMPATTWLGLSGTPGDIPGLGPADASTCRDLAGTLAANPATRWCITLTDAKGRAIAHGCARAGPGPPATTGTTTTGDDRRSWLAKITVTPIATGTCDHRRESAGYQPSDRLRHLVKTRSPRSGPHPADAPTPPPPSPTRCKAPRQPQYPALRPSGQLRAPGWRTEPAAFHQRVREQVVHRRGQAALTI